MGIFPSKNLEDYIRVLKLTSKPDASEVKLVAAVAGGGLTVVGFLGFVIYTVMSFIPV